MNKNKKSVLNIISISLIFFVLSLSFIGFGYGMWFKGLHISTFIDSGNVNIDYTHVCMSSFCCGCHSNISYTWDANHVFVSASKNVSGHCKILLVAKIKNTGSLPVNLRNIVVEAENSNIFQNIRLYATFYSGGACSFTDPASYPMRLNEGSNEVNPRPVHLDKGQYIYFTVLLVFKYDHCSNSSSNSNHITIKLPWYLYNSDYNGWRSIVSISYDLSI